MTISNPTELRPRIPKPADFKPEPVFGKAHKWAGTPRCQAWRPRLGRQCAHRAKPRPGGGHPAFPDTHMRVCRLDGGDTPVGIASPHWKGNGVGRFVPLALEPAFLLAMRNGDLLSGMRTLALLAGREETLLKRIDTGEAGRTWAALGQEWEALARLLQREDPDRGQVRERITAISLLMARGRADAQAWEELFTVWEQQRRTIETEMRRREKARTLIPMEDMLWHVERLMQMIRERILEFPDLPARSARKLLQLIADGYAGILGTRLRSRQLPAEWEEPDAAAEA